jgi:phosphoenolpyruvate-protein kinase (PTS system EI component)
LRGQLRAILRAAENGEAGILLPMVTTVEDIRRVKRHLEIARRELRREEKPFSPKIALGAMIEVPAAAFSTGEILRKVDFVSVGTNDLLQYFLAADRDNPELVEYGETPGPGFLSLMSLIIEQAIDQGRQNDVSICGEMAANPSVLPALLRLGYRSFSISPVLAPAVRKAAAATALDPSSPGMVRG